MPGRVGVDVFAVELYRAERQDARAGSGHILDHDVEVKLLRYGRVRPGGRAMAGDKLEGQAGRGRTASHHDPVVAAVGDRKS